MAVTHVTQCDGCIDLHVQNALRLGATPAEIAEAIWVAAELRAGAAVGQLRVAAHRILAAATPSGGTGV
ncbi:Carboxymuconolactone decarboxylase family protein [compost metagenome]